MIIEEENITKPESQAAVAQGRVTLSHLWGLDDHLEAEMARIKHAMYMPDHSKPGPKFNAAQLAVLCGRSHQSMLRHLDKADELGLSSGVQPQDVGSKQRKPRSFTLEEARDWVRSHEGIRHKRQPGQQGAVITVGFFKGGVGKTTIACSLAQALALMGYKVLAIDLDPQGSLTAMMGANPATVETEETIEPICRPPTDPAYRKSLMPSIRPTYWSGADLIAGSTSLFSCEFFLPARSKAEPGFNFLGVMEEGLKGAIREEYDYIIIDTPPALSYITMNAYMASDAILVPVVPEGLSLQSSVQFWSQFCELSQFAVSLNRAEKEYAWVGVVPSLVGQSGLPATQTMMKWLRSCYGHYVLGSEIPRTEAVKAGSAQLHTVYDIQKNEYSGGSKTYDRARDAFDRLVREVDSLTRVSCWGASVSQESEA